MARILIVEDNRELATLLGSVARIRGHTAKEVHQGASALKMLADEPFDVAIVDLLLPDVSGNDILDDLKRRAIPAFAISGVYKGDPFAKDAIESHGATAFYEKPFDIQAVLETLEKVTGIPPRISGAAETVSEEFDIDVELGPLQEEGDAQRPKMDAKGIKPASAGELAQSPVPRLLTAYYQSRYSGELKLRRDNILKLVFFQGGRPIYAASNVLAERFGPFCVNRGALSASELQAVQTLAEKERLGTGQAAIRLGFMTEAQRERLVEEQARTIIWSTFPWSEGTYEFASKQPGRSDLVKLALAPAELILQGISRVEPLVTLRRKMPLSRRLIPSADPPYPLHELTLSSSQALLLAYADGTKKVEDLLALTELSEREALATLLSLELLGILVERPDDNSTRRITFGL